VQRGGVGAPPARVPVEGALRGRSVLPRRRPRRPCHPARAAAHDRPGGVRRDRGHPARRPHEGGSAALTPSRWTNRMPPPASEVRATFCAMAERVELWWARRQFSRGAEVPYAVGTYREAWASFPMLVRQYHPELNAGIVLSQIPPAADVL